MCVTSIDTEALSLHLPLVWCCTQRFLPAALKPLRLASLHVLLPQEEWFITQYIVEQEDFRHTHAREESRARALAALAQPLADALPTIGLLSIADTAMSRCIFLNDQGIWERRVPERDPSKIYVWDDLRGVSRIYELRWWKVVQAEGGGRALVEIAEEEGMSAQEFIESPEWDAQKE